MSNIIKLVAVATLSAFLLQPTAPINKQVSAQTTEPKEVKSATSQIETVEEPVVIPAPEPAETTVEEAPAPVAEAAPVVQAVTVTGDCDQWIAAAGITDLTNAKELIRRESNCRPHAVNPSSGACGVAQELPCGKSGCDRSDGACQVNWMNTYVKARYGSWANAVAFHDRNNWY